MTQPPRQPAYDRLQARLDRLEHAIGVARQRLGSLANYSTGDLIDYCRYASNALAEVDAIYLPTLQTTTPQPATEEPYDAADRDRPGPVHHLHWGGL